MESKIGSILLLISAILTFIVAGILLIIGVAIPFLPAENMQGNPIFGMIIFLVIAILFFIVAFLKLWASRLMKVPETTSKGGIVAIVVGILNGGDLLAIIGGIIGIVQAGK